MAGRFQDKVAIITGGSKGIGEGCVRVFHKNGAKVVFCSRGEEEGRKLEAELNQNPGTNAGEVAFIRCDVTKEEEIRAMIHFAVEKFGRLDCLINNAGWHPPHQPIDQFSAEDFRFLLDTNLVSYFLASKYALPHLRKTQGSIINVSSLVATLGQVGAVTYVATKGGINGLTNALAVDEAKYNVRVNTLSPGNIWTPLWEAGVKNLPDAQKQIDAGAEAQLLGRFGTIHEAGEACLFLAAEATFTTGTNLPLTGGAELNYGMKNRQNKSDTNIF